MENRLDKYKDAFSKLDQSKVNKLDSILKDYFITYSEFADFNTNKYSLDEWVELAIDEQKPLGALFDDWDEAQDYQYSALNNYQPDMPDHMNPDIPTAFYKTIWLQLEEQNRYGEIDKMWDVVKWGYPLFAELDSKQNDLVAQITEAALLGLQDNLDGLINTIKRVKADYPEQFEDGKWDAEINPLMKDIRYANATIKIALDKWRGQRQELATPSPSNMEAEREMYIKKGVQMERQIIELGQAIKKNNKIIYTYPPVDAPPIEPTEDLDSTLYYEAYLLSTEMRLAGQHKWANNSPIKLFRWACHKYSVNGVFYNADKWNNALKTARNRPSMLQELRR